MAHSLLRHLRCLSALTTRRSIGTGSLALAVVLGAGGGCYMDPINRAPYIVSIKEIGVVPKNQDAKMRITAYDPDSDRLTITWAAVAGKCMDRPAAVRSDGDPVSEGLEVTVDRSMTGGRFCVWAFATDRYGATSVLNNTFDPENAAPQPRIDVVDPAPADSYRLYSEIVLTSDGSMDPDDPLGLSFSWNLRNKPAGSIAELKSTGCKVTTGITAGDLHCFSADKPGQYEVELMAAEAAGDGNTPTLSGKVTRTFTVNPEVLPSILETKPALRDGSIPVLEDTKFEVTKVDDDGDPLPAATPNQLSYTWFLTGPDGLVQTLENDFPWLSLVASRYHVGDRVKLRVEVHDRNGDACDRALLLCHDDDLCIAPGNRVLRVTWNLLWSAAL